MFTLATLLHIVTHYGSSVIVNTTPVVYREVLYYKCRCYHA